MDNEKTLVNEKLYEVVKTALKGEQQIPVEPKEIADPEIKNPRTLDNIDKLINELVRLMGSEEAQRKSLLRFLKYFLCVSSVVPILASMYLKFIGVLGVYELLAVIIVIPVEVIGIFSVISKNLFGNDYRNTIPPMIGEIYQSIVKNNEFK